MSSRAGPPTLERMPGEARARASRCMPRGGRGGRPVAVRCRRRARARRPRASKCIICRLKEATRQRACRGQASAAPPSPSPPGGGGREGAVLPWDARFPALLPPHLELWFLDVKACASATHHSSARPGCASACTAAGRGIDGDSVGPGPSGDGCGGGSAARGWWFGAAAAMRRPRVARARRPARRTPQPAELRRPARWPIHRAQC